MLIKQHTPRLLELIRYASKDSSLELEARIKQSKNNTLDSEAFFNVMKRLKGTRGIKLLEESVNLDIGLTGDYDNIRVSIKGDQNITDYCQKNDIKLINNKTVSYMKKIPVRYVDVNEYNFRFNLKREENLNTKDNDVVDIIKNWTRLDKTFRYKKRFSFITDDGLFRFDLTTLKSSSKKMVVGKNKFMKKSQIKSHMVKYIVKPEYVVDVKSWFGKQPLDSNIEMRGKSFPQLKTFKSLQKSQVLKNELEYEIEIEYLGNNTRMASSKQGDINILSLFLQKIIIVLQSLQKSYYIISESERSNVIDQYKSIMGDYKFNGPMNVSLTRQHIIEKNYEEYKDSVSIRKGYSVTDKADGERNLLLVLKGGEMFLLNRKNVVKKLDARCPELEMSIFDTEYLMKDKNNNNINLIMIFDVYFVNSEDVRDRILNRTEEEIKKDIIDKSRYEIMLEKMLVIESGLQKSSNNNLEILRKKFFFGDDDIFDEQTNLSINKIKSLLADMDPKSKEYLENMKQLSVLKKDTKIFKEAEKVYNKSYPYHIDGLVFTPRNMKVGEEPNKEKKNMFNGRWYNCFKWKPPEENSIDFLAIFKKEEDKSSYETKYITVGGNTIECRIVALHVGYDKNIHTKYNSYKVLNENVVFQNGYLPAPFVPTEPYIKDIHICYIPVKNGNCYTLDGNIITDNSIIECSYDKSVNKQSVGLWWKPMRVRDTLRPNDFITANNVWKSIFSPVTLDMITSGNMPYKSNVYFDNNKKRSDKQSKPMNDFHSYIKKKLLKDNLLGKKSLLDLGVGKAGDLNHWLEADCNMIVGLDSVKDNLDNPENGACNRILNKYSSIDNSKKNKSQSIKNLLDNTLMIWSDCSKSIIKRESALDDIGQYYLDVLNGVVEESNITNSKLKRFYNKGSEFDLVVSNFAIHYFFENEESIKNILSNISNSLKEGGRFVCTMLDGENLFEILKYNRIYHSNNLSWKITRKYNSDIFPRSAKSLGYKIEVFVDSIGQSIDEYLVNSSYFEDICSDYGLKLIQKNNFKELYSGIIANTVSYGDMQNIDSEYQKYSFLNMYMVFEKNTSD